MTKLVEDNGLVAVKDNTALRKVLDSGSEDIALDIATSVGQLLGAHTVVHTDDVLLNDRALIEVAGDEMGSSTDNLDTAVVSLVVRLGTLEGRQEGVVDVDDAAGHGFAELGRQDLHVAGEHNQVNVVLGGQLEDLAFLLGLGGCGHWEVVEGDVVGCGERREVGVVGDDQGDLNAELTGGLAEEKVVQAVADLGDHHQDAGLLVGRVDLVIQSEGIGGGLESSAQLLQFGEVGGSIRRKLGAHEEALGGGVTILR